MILYTIIPIPQIENRDHISTATWAIWKTAWGH